MSPKHVAFVAPRLAEGSAVGGAETLIRQLAIRTAASGCKVSFLTTCAQNHFTWENEIPPGEKQTDGMQVHFFPVDDRDVPRFLASQERICRGGTVAPGDESTWLEQNVNSTALCDHIRNHANEYDAIIVGPYLFGLIYFASQVCPQKTVLVPCLHDEAFAYLPAFATMFASVRRIVFNAEPERALARRIFELKDCDTRVLGMGIDAFETDGDRFRRAHGISSPYLVYCGRREPLKGTPLLLDYLATFRKRTDQDISLVLTGSGDVAPPAELAPHIVDVGFVSEQEKHDAMAGALAFCHPSTNESFGIVLLESWLAGTPVLVHAGGEVLPDQCRRARGGLWFNNYPEFEECLKAFLQNPPLVDAMAQAGRQFVESTYSWEAVTPRLLEALSL